MADLQKLLLATLSPNYEQRSNAEIQLTETFKQQGSMLRLLRLIGNPEENEAVRLAAAVLFKNNVKAAWDTTKDEEDRKGVFISVGDRTNIKTSLVELMCTVSGKIQNTISESISIIAVVDYPDQWKGLMPSLVQKLASVDVSIVNGVLATADTICMSFRYVQRSDPLYEKIAYTLQYIQEPLLQLFAQTTSAVNSSPNDVQVLVPMFETLRLIVNIYYSLVYQDLPAFYEDNMQPWMDGFSAYLQYTNPALVDDDEETMPDIIGEVQIVIVSVFILYLERDEETWVANYLSNFTSIVWSLLIGTSMMPKHDQLAVISMKYLTLLVGKKSYEQLFKDDATLEQIVAKIVIPNITPRESDLDNFEESPNDFILTELEGADNESRRRCSKDLLKAMCRQFESRTTAICSKHIHQLIEEFKADPANKWTCKDAAISLMVGIAIHKESSFGVSEINGNVDLLGFFAVEILSELQDFSYNSRPLVKAASLNFVCTFRNQFSNGQLVELLPLLINGLGSPHVVVQSLAANAIEEIVRGKDPGMRNYKLTRTDLEPFLESLFTSLFRIIDQGPVKENPYVMKCIMRAMDRADDGVIGVANIVFGKLSAALEHAVKNPSVPDFNHNLFESVAILVKSVCSKNASNVDRMEEMLFPVFQTILQMEVLEFTPYVFQILAQLLEFRSPESGLGTSYESLLPPLLTAGPWEKIGNVPGLTRLIEAYLKQAASELVARGQLTQILGIFQKLNASKATESSAFDLLFALFQYVLQDAMQPYLKTILQLVLTRLKGTKSRLYPIRTAQYFALFCGFFGGEMFVNLTNELQAGLSVQLIASVWLPKVVNASSSPLLAKSQIVGLSRFAFETPLLGDDTGKQILGQIVLAIVTMLLSTSFSKEAKELPDESPMVYDATFSSLKYTTKVPVDPFPQVKNPISFFLSLLKSLSEAHPGTLFSIVEAAFGSDEKLLSDFNALLHNNGVHIA